MPNAARNLRQVKRNEWRPRATGHGQGARPGHRWKRLMESGRLASVTELAEAETINQSYLCRVLRLTLLAPDVVENRNQSRARNVLLVFMSIIPSSSEAFASNRFQIMCYEFILR